MSANVGADEGGGNACSKYLGWLSWGSPGPGPHNTLHRYFLKKNKKNKKSIGPRKRRVPGSFPSTSRFHPNKVNY